MKEGDSVLINGASGAVGSMAVMITKHFGAIVTGVCSTSNISNVANLGANRVIDYKEEDFTKEINKYDIIFDAVGKSSYKSVKESLNETGIYLTTVPILGVMIQVLTKKKLNKRRASFIAAGLREPNVKIEDLIYLEKLVISVELKPLYGKSHNLGNVTIRVFE
ncbi:MAG: Quinone oxidoreductase 1 [Candidatus Izimaplasma bacterium HR2]|nr:MAG: Quinone oxidoreductase 1 [Candidatus Izimaplasma bacterium HR2]